MVLEEECKVEINKLADLVPYREHLKTLWEEERFQPVVAFLSSLIKEQNDILVIKASVASNEPTKTLTELAICASVVRTLKVIARLPEAIKEVEDQLEEVRKQKERIMRSTESGGI